jgi:hypothetical protein
MGSTPGSRGLEKLYIDIISQNVRGFNHKVATIKLRNEREMICISAHPEAEKLEEQHHNAQYAHTSFLTGL